MKTIQQDNRVDPKLDQNGAGDRADADSIQQQVVLGVVHESGVSHRRHLRRCSRCFCWCRVDHRHEQLVGVHEHGSSCAHEHTTHC